LYSSLRWSLSLCSFSLSSNLPYFMARPNPQTLDRRRGFSSHTTKIIFVAIVINFFLSSLATGSQVAAIIVLIRRALVLDVDHLSEKSQLVNTATWGISDVIDTWAGSLAVSTILWLPDSTSNNARHGGEDIAQRLHCHLEGLGPHFRVTGATVGNPRTVYYMDWSPG